MDKLKQQYEGVRLERQKRYLPFTVAEQCSFDSLYERRFSNDIGQLINAAIRQIEADNNQQLASVNGLTYENVTVNGKKLPDQTVNIDAKGNATKV